MSKITTAMIKDLRAQTGAGIMDAKAALTETDGDIEGAVDWLRKKGLAKAAKKSDRTASEGLVVVSTSGTKGAVVEINSETDFVARNEEFQTFARKVSDIALNVESIEALAAAEYESGKSVQDTLTDLIAKIGENMSLRRMACVNVQSGAVAAYVHGELAPNMGTIGVLVGLESGKPADDLAAVGRQLAMHVAAANPQALDKNSVDPEALNREKDVLKEQAIASGKPAEIAEKMVEGRLRKYYEEICLVEQKYVIDGESRVEDVAQQAGATITGFARIQLGEGIEKEEEDFAAEVAKAANG